MSADPTSIMGGERMFAHRAGLCKGLLTLACAAGLIAFAGCGGESPATTSVPSERAATAEADPGDLEVIEGWSSTLRSGDVEGAADYFAIPSTAQNGPLLVEIEDRSDAVAFNTSLPCGAEVIAARTEGDFTSATFRLTERPGGDCGPGVGERASTSFQIEDGRIVEWRRIDSPGGAPGGPVEDGSGDAPV